MKKFKGIIHTDYHNNIIERYCKGESSVKIAKDFNVTYQTILKIIKFYGKPIKRCGVYKKFNFDDNFFENIDTEEKAYFLGFILADGYVSKYGLVIALQPKDREILEKFVKCIKGNNNILDYHDHKSTFGLQSYCRLSINSSKMKSDLNKLGLHNNKTNDVIAPIIKEELERHFWRGVYDGDGWISSYEFTPKYKNKKTNKITTYPKKIELEVGICGHLNTMESFYKFLEKNKISSGKIAKIKSIYRVRIAKHKIKFLEFIYKDANIFLKRKYDKYINYIEHICS
jgi:hypothetical protein